MTRRYTAPAQPRTFRPDGARVHDAARLAQMVADGSSIHAAGLSLDLTRGETSSTWRRICAELGPQAS